MTRPRRIPSLAFCDFGECALSKTCVEYNALKNSDTFLNPDEIGERCNEYLEPVRTKLRHVVPKFKIKNHRARYE